MLEATTKIINIAKYSKMMVIPAEMFNDSSFPFKMGDKLKIRIFGQSLVITRCSQCEGE